jgi:hypothetical protein
MLRLENHQHDFSKLHSSTLIQKIKIPRPLSHASASNHPNVFTVTMSRRLESSGRPTYSQFLSDFFCRDCYLFLRALQCPLCFGTSLACGLRRYVQSVASSTPHTLNCSACCFLGHCATSRNVAGSIPDEVIGFSYPPLVTNRFKQLILRISRV